MRGEDHVPACQPLVLELGPAGIWRGPGHRVGLPGSAVTQGVLSLGGLGYGSGGRL